MTAPFRADREAVVFVSRRRRGFVSGGPENPKGWRGVSFPSASLLAGAERGLCANRRQAIPATSAFVVARQRQPRGYSRTARAEQIRLYQVINKWLLITVMIRRIISNNVLLRSHAEVVDILLTAVDNLVNNLFRGGCDILLKLEAFSLELRAFGEKPEAENLLIHPLLQLNP